MKTVIILLAITTLIAVLAAFIFSDSAGTSIHTFSFTNQADLFFLIALIGWMPAPLDIALWHSEWTLDAANEKREPLSISNQFSILILVIGEPQH